MLKEFLKSVGSFLLCLFFLGVVYGENLVSNFSFERGNDGFAEGWELWGAGGDKAVRTYELSKGGQFCLKLERRRSEDWVGGSSNRWKVQGIKKWFVSAFINKPKGGLDDFLYLRFWDEKGNFILQTGPRLPSQTEGWKLVSGFVETPPGAEFVDFSVQVWSPAPSIVLIDDVFVVSAEGKTEEELRREAKKASENVLPSFLIPGTEGESRWIEKNEGSRTQIGVRTFKNGESLIYRFPRGIFPYNCFRIEKIGPLYVEVWQNNEWRRLRYSAKLISGRQEIYSYKVEQRGEYIRLRLVAGKKEAKFFKMDFCPDGPDLDMDGISDILEKFLGEEIERNKGPFACRFEPPRTSFQTHIGYQDIHDYKTDIVIIADNNPEKIASWRAKGYEVHTMYGFRDGDAWVKEHPEEVQTTESGLKLTCGPGSYYLVPTENRVRKALEYFRRALEGGTRAVCPEEPEFFAFAGYSDAFKKAFEERYGKSWSASQDPQNRWLWELLKGDMEINILSEIYKLAKSYDPTVKRFLLAHSPLNYTALSVVFPHYKMLKTGLVDEVIDQTWSDMIRGPMKYAGVNKQRLVENAYLCYASALGYALGIVKNIWFIQDPLADNPSLSIDEYRREYEANVIGALLLPQVSNYEILPWPERISGRIPPWYEREITSVINALSEMKDFDGKVEWGNPHGEVGVALGDGAVYQRGGPYASDMDSFYGLMLPVLYMGYFLEIPHLDRFAEKGYLDKYKVLLVTYDPQKPLSPAVNEALADWVKNGGILIMFGGGDPFDSVEEWWRKLGFASPQDHLLNLLGINVESRKILSPQDESPHYEVALETPYKGRTGENRGWYEVDLTPYLEKTGEVYVKFEDTIKDDGWGPAVFRVEIVGEKEGKEFKISFKPGEGLENQYMFIDKGSQMFGDDLRFADGQAYWIYRFNLGKNTRARLRVDIQNQFRISISPYEARIPSQLIALDDCELKSSLPIVPLKGETSITSYEVNDAKELYRLENEAIQGKVCFSKNIGKGKLYFFGFNPAVCARSIEGAKLVQALVENAMKAKEENISMNKASLSLKRGPYIIAYSFGDELVFKGKFINIFSPDIKLELEHTVKPGEWCLLKDVNDKMSAGYPSLLWTASKLNFLRENEKELKMLLSGPEEASGASRIYLAGKNNWKVEAVDSLGKRVNVEVNKEGETLLLIYKNKASGVAIKIEWR
ncbi:hypothetical protein H5T87_04010 [bacterium]|nr:hypothetical protein [bacterium]